MNLPSPTRALGTQVQNPGKRDEIFLATKFSLGHGEPDRLVKANACKESLLRLGVDYVDLCYLTSPR